VRHTPTAIAQWAHIGLYSLSSLAHEGLLHSHHLGIRTVFTDHSLFSLDDATGILTNKLLAGALKSADAIIGVSHTGYAHIPFVCNSLIYSQPREHYAARQCRR
jgi:hypothetical protein